MHSQLQFVKETQFGVTPHKCGDFSNNDQHQRLPIFIPFGGPGELEGGPEAIIKLPKRLRVRINTYTGMRVTSTRTLSNGTVRQRLTNGRDYAVLEGPARMFETGKTYTIERRYKRA